MKRLFFLTSSRGVTLIEILLGLALVAVIVTVFGFGLLGGVIMGNEWYSEAGVLKAIRVDHPEAKTVLISNRCFYKKSEFVVEGEDGRRAKYYLDSNILFSYDITTTP
jgi:hypothetical protein